MTKEQEIIGIIANAADSIGDKPMAFALRELQKELDIIPSYEHMNVLRMAWGEEKGEC